MIHFSTSQAVSWPTPPARAVAPVSPVAVVQPVREAGRDAPAGLGAGRDGQAVSAARSPATHTDPPEAAAPVAPLLPSAYGPSGRAGDRSGSAPDALPGAPASAAQQQAAEKAEQAAAQAVEEAAKAAAEQPSPPLQAVLTTVWEASAAVVERALGRLSGTEAEVPGIQSDTAPDLSALAAAPMQRPPLTPAAEAAVAAPALSWPVMPASASDDEAPLPFNPPEEGLALDALVAYDEHGNGSRAPIEVGSLISERV